MITIGDISNVAQVMSGPALGGEMLPRVAFVGRSNVGKSSLINAILGEKNLAYVSKQPGKTKGIHFFMWPEEKKIIADLPGYGFAKTARDERDRWMKFINAYLKKDILLKRVYVLLDSRRGFMESDLQALDFLTGLKIPFSLVMTKIDQLKNQKEASAQKKAVKSVLDEMNWDESKVFWVSSKSKDGLGDLLKAVKAEGQ